jgi:hypothetical protein
MALFTPEQRTVLYLQAAERAGIHAPILAALYQVQQQPSLPQGETGLGIAPANRITLEQVNGFAEQVQYAASTIRSLTNHLIDQGWKGADLWDGERDRYTPRCIRAIAAGFTAPTSDPAAALLESSDPDALEQAYIANLPQDHGTTLLQNRVYLEQALLTLVERLPRSYIGLPQQREALLQAFRLWHQLDTRAAAIATLQSQFPVTADPGMEESVLNSLLLQSIQTFARSYAGYPHQREAFLRLTQLWRQLDSRQRAIASLLTDASPEPDPSLVDPTLIALVQRIPALYRGRGDQRNALVEGFRLWQELEFRSDALLALGIDAEIFANPTPDQSTLLNAATQADLRLLDFIRSLPGVYTGLERQREALLRLTQLWRGLETRTQTLQSLWEDLKQMHRADRNSPEAAPPPPSILPPSRPTRWTPETIQIHAAILPNGSFTWAEATAGGVWIPANQHTVDTIIRMATLVQQVRDRLQRPLHITRWYCSQGNNRHPLGDAIEFYCTGLTGDQLYWYLDSWWTGGLGHYRQFPYLCYLDGRSDRVRWRE